MDLVVVGHVTLDETGRGTRPGGAAYYATLTAARLGLHVALLTSFGDDYPPTTLPGGVEVARVRPDRTTRYAIRRSAGGRHLTLRTRAGGLGPGDLPPAWRHAPLAMLCPVADEVDTALAAAFPDAAVAALPQGWMRRIGPGGAVSATGWASADAVLPRLQLLALSEEDLGPGRTDPVEWFDQIPLGAVTRAAAGATLYVNGEPYHVAADPVAVVDDTGAGDVFATTLLIEYHRRTDPWQAAAAAACAAAAAITGEGGSAIPDREQLEARLATYLRRQGA